ncbi:hypothetical protein SADUNF_Sadunf16G0274700 [Salix dunnii]|uniref:Apple domain-containing protein n=1 Tax=Salix dunnii TaxID=1413687 RepID=A0A835JGQ8_9ROSI|nr:hypothetical protein SADUNF_Sadunf16G0274700 [Salix dunnii]
MSNLIGLTILLLLSCFTSFFTTSLAADTIAANQNITDGKTIVSSAPGLDVTISSWRSVDDPSPGYYIFEVDPKRLELVVNDKSDLRSRSGPWNGIGFSGLPYLKPDPIYNYTFVFNDEVAYFTYDLYNISVITTLVLYEDGIMNRLTWIERTNSWIVYASAPADNCDNYNLCGAYGRCNIGTSPACSCLNRFVPENQEQWQRADWSSGCIRRTPLDCKVGDGFIKYSNVKLPQGNNWMVNVSMTTEQCKAECLKNCSCMAYANSDVRGKGSGCFLWFDQNLIDIRQYTVDGQDLYIRMAASEAAAANQEQGGSKGDKKVGVIVGSILASLFVICMGIYLFIRKKKKQKRYATSHGRSRLEQLPEDTFSISHHEEDLDLPHYDFATLAKATNDFSFTHFLGEGGYGPVYRAWKLFKEGRPLELNDNLIVETCDLTEVMRSIHVGLLCVQHSPEDRPSMSTVVLMLSGEGTLPQPKEPGFFTERKLIDASSSSSKPESCSVNEVTVTMIDPRCISPCGPGSSSIRCLFCVLAWTAGCFQALFFPFKSVDIIHGLTPLLWRLSQDKDGWNRAGCSPVAVELSFFPLQKQSCNGQPFISSIYVVSISNFVVKSSRGSSRKSYITMADCKPLAAFSADTMAAIRDRSA